MLTNLVDSIRNLFAPHQPLPAGTYHYQAPPEAPNPYRLHLRLEPDGTGLLIVNARTVLHLNPTAAEYAYYLVKRVPPQEAAYKVHTRYHVSLEQALKDFTDLTGRIQTLIHTPDLDPVTFLDFERQDPYSADLSAPYRLDCALTYRLPDGEHPASAPIERAKTELPAEAWKTILNKAWDVGIPQVVFTGGEPTLRDDLPELIAHAESLGQVAGLLTDGLRMANPAYLDTLLKSGLDHVMIVLEPEVEASWEALRNLIAADIFVTVHLTLTPETAGQVDPLLDRLAEMGVRTVSLSANDPSLAEALKSAQAGLANRLMTLIWDLPVPYSDLHPVALERPEDAPRGAGQAWLYVEPDGDVLPAQGVNQVLGNLLSDPWAAIWKQRRG